MREVITLSLPKDTATKIRLNAKKRGLSISHYVIHSIENQESMISEEEVLVLNKEIKKDKKNWKTFSWLSTLKALYEGK